MKPPEGRQEMSAREPNQLEVCLDPSSAKNKARIAERRVASFATIKPVPLTSENAGRVGGAPVEDKAKRWSFALTANFCRHNARATPQGGGSSPLIFAKSARRKIHSRTELATPFLKKTKQFTEENATEPLLFGLGTSPSRAVSRARRP